MLARLDLRGLDATSLAAALPPLTIDDDGPRQAVREVLDAVRAGGDAAVRELTARFDGIDVAATRVEYPRVATLPFDSDYKLMATFHRMTDGQGRDVVRCFVKGAPDQLHALPEGREPA